MTRPMKKEQCNPPFIPMSRIEVEDVLRISRSKIYEMINPENPRYDASFPKPVRWGARSVMWKQEEVYEWMRTRETVSRIDDDE
jgi:prophage regulatory protein